MARKLSKRNNGAKQAELGLQHTCTALYLRVSTEKQATEGNSMAAQEAKLTDYCKAMQWHVGEGHIYKDEGISGKSADNRPALQAMLQAAKEGKIQRIVVTKFDRLARNVKDLMDIMDTLNKVGCALVLLDINVDTGTPTGKLIAGIMGQLAEWERSLISERVMSGKRHQATEGEYNGSRCPLGYDFANGEFTINEQAATVGRIFDLFLSGQSINAIAKAMNETQTQTAMGGKWYASTVRTILGNGAYAGVAQWDGVEAAEVTTKDDKGNETKTTPRPAIISKEVYEQAHKRLQALRPGKQLESEIERRLQHA